MTDTGDLHHGLLALTCELQVAHFTWALRCLAAEVKYDPSQPRLPKGVHGGGRWGAGPAGPAKVKAPARTPGSGLAIQLGRAALANPEAAPAAGVAALPMAAGAVGVSRAAGLYDHYTTGNAITPILGLDGGKLETGPPPLTMGRGRQTEPLEKFDADCEDQLKEDLIACDTNAALYGGGRRGYSRKEIRAICKENASFRCSECLTGKS